MNNLFTTKVSYEHLEQLRTFLNEHNTKVEASDMTEFISNNDIKLVIKDGLIVNASITNDEGTKYITEQYIQELERTD